METGRDGLKSVKKCWGSPIGRMLSSRHVHRAEMPTERSDANGTEGCSWQDLLLSFWNPVRALYGQICPDRIRLIWGAFVRRGNKSRLNNQTTDLSCDRNLSIKYPTVFLSISATCHTLCALSSDILSPPGYPSYL
jgi:hypothetical protein